MKRQKRKLKVGILGCGAIGSRIAQSIKNDLKNDCSLVALFDIDQNKTQTLQKNLQSKGLVQKNLLNLIQKSDLIVEACNDENTLSILKEIVKSKKHVLVMSSGKLLNANSLFKMAKQNNCSILVPTGAIAGLDAIKSSAIAGIKSITITTRKPPKGLMNNPYLITKKIDLSKIKKETVIFDGKVSEAVKAFPQNINVAATLAIASGCRNKLHIRIITAPKYTTNSHEIEVISKAGKIITRTENLPCPDNPKTSYLAPLSGIQTLKQFCEGIFIGT